MWRGGWGGGRRGAGSRRASGVEDAGGAVHEAGGVGKLRERSRESRVPGIIIGTCRHVSARGPSGFVDEKRSFEGASCTGEKCEYRARELAFWLTGHRTRDPGPMRKQFGRVPIFGARKYPPRWMKKSGAVRGKSAPLFRLFCEHPLWSPRRRGTPRRARLGTARAHLRARTLALAQDLRRRDARTPDARHHDLRVRRNPRASGRVDGNLGACDASKIPRPRSDATGPRRRVEPRRAEPSAARRGPPPRVRARRRDALEPVRGGAARARLRRARARSVGRRRGSLAAAGLDRRGDPVPGPSPDAPPLTPPSPPRRPRRASRAPPGPPPRPASPRGASARSAGAPAPGSPRDPKVRQISPLARANDPRRALALKRGRRARSRVRARRARARPRLRLTRHPPRPSPRPALAGTAAFARARDVLKVRAPGRVRAASSRDFRTGVSARRATRPTRPCPLARAPKRSFATG